jgi:predicted  nucleic acid-binding Zn-ribbon protein
MNRCIECGRANLKAAERMAQHGFGCCGLRPTFEYVPLQLEHNCQHFAQAPDEVVKQRLEWLERKENMR